MFSSVISQKDQQITGETILCSCAAVRFKKTPGLQGGAPTPRPGNSAGKEPRRSDPETGLLTGFGIFGSWWVFLDSLETTGRQRLRRLSGPGGRGDPLERAPPPAPPPPPRPDPRRPPRAPLVRNRPGGRRDESPPNLQLRRAGRRAPREGRGARGRAAGGGAGGARGGDPGGVAGRRGAGRGGDPGAGRRGAGWRSGRGRGPTEALLGARRKPAGSPAHGKFHFVKQPFAHG